MSYKVLITGSSGFLGSSCVKKFLEEGLQIYGISRTLPNNCQLKKNNFIAQEISLEALKSFKQNFDFIIHCAGGSYLPYSYSNPKKDFTKTVLTSLEVLEYVRLYNPRAKVIYISSASVYNTNSSFPIDETVPLAPCSPYGVSKSIAEQLFKSYYDNFGINSCILRVFSAYGEGLKKQLFWVASNKIYHAQKEHANKVTFYNTGKNIRDWVYITDVVEAIFSSLNIDFNFDIFNCGGNSNSVLRVVNLLAQELGFEGKIIFNDGVKLGHPLCLVANNSKIYEKTSWRAKITLQEGVKKYIAWFKEEQKKKNEK